MAMTKDMSRYWREEFDKAMLEIDMDSSPGLCQFAQYGPTNAAVFKYKDGVWCKDREKEVRDVVFFRMQQLLRGELVADDIKMFVKPEPHKPEKMAQGRFRLISAVSLVDALVDRILFGWLSRKALTVVGKTPCLTGWSPVHGGWKYIEHRFSGKPVVCLDKSSWDWTVQEWLITAWFEFLKGLALGADSWWVELVSARFQMLFERPIYQFADGTRVQQKYVGIMKSGCFLTLILNSVGQSMLHYVASLRIGRNPIRNQPISVGDDTTQESFPELEEYINQISRLGAKVKGFKVRHWVEFIGFAWIKGVCVPAYWQKHLFKLQYSHLEDVLQSYQILYANEPVMFELLRRLAKEVNPELVMSSYEAKAIMNY
ncbi:hypothetical protein 2 [Hubei sobemo-like virus 10]|uniref:hypothetical protein 2 n=1 Tax=Hubei sobemo-like virus 10 TaxID=1923195 RepID=UPI00090A2F84|nr:hypothetical protein 2 [Hubei sobemo-like virus 10]APG75854.1 hypothetical protein 2 [Hubei sobemo-like virus 10]